MVQECREELLGEGIEIKPDIPLGMMIEIPSTAVMAEIFAQEADFFSIGTNDLTQYTLAVDRGNEEIADLYTYLHPAVLKLIKQAIDGAHKHGKLCGMCGEADVYKRQVPVSIAVTPVAPAENTATAAKIPAKVLFIIISASFGVLYTYVISL